MVVKCSNGPPLLFSSAKDVFEAGNMSGRAAFAGLIPSLEAAPSAPSAEEMEVPVIAN